MEKRNIWKCPQRLSTIPVAMALFLVAPALQAQVLQKKQAFPQLSSEQYQRILALHPDTSKPVFISVKIRVSRGDLTQVNVVGSCGDPDVDQFVQKWVWNTFHYDRNFSGDTFAKIRVNSPILKNPQPRLSWRAWQEVYKADPLNNGKHFVSHLSIVIRDGKIADVKVVKSSGLPLVDQEFCDFIRTKWVAEPGVTLNFPAFMQAHRGYYPQ